MGTSTGSFADLIGEDRKARQEHSWTGTFLEYLELVRGDPTIPKLAHARLYEAVTAAGSADLGDTDDPHLNHLFGDERIKRYHYFEKEFFGIERSIAQIVRYLHSAALRGEESRQVLYLMGPVGAGKSSLVAKLQRALEETEPVYAIDGCPIAEEPLHLVPVHLRRSFADVLGVPIEGEQFRDPIDAKSPSP